MGYEWDIHPDFEVWVRVRTVPCLTHAAMPNSNHWIFLRGANPERQPAGERSIGEPRGPQHLRARGRRRQEKTMAEPWGFTMVKAIRNEFHRYLGPG